MAAGHEGAGAAEQLRRRHPPAVRAGRERLHRRRPEAHRLQVLLHAQGHLHEGVRRLRAAARRLRHARRGVRAADADADRQDGHPPGRPARRRRAAHYWTRLARVRARAPDRRAASARRRTCRSSSTAPTRSTAPSAIIERFYANYDSARYVGERLILRLRARARSRSSSRAEPRLRRPRRAAAASNG